MIRVVFDTNIVISALLQPLGPPAQVFELAISGVIEFCVSGDIYTEYEEVVRRPRFKRSEEIVAGLLQAVREKGRWVRPAARVRVCLDPDDDIFLECAQAAEAGYLVTGNFKDFPTLFGVTRIVTAKELLDIVGKGEAERQQS
jgi:uncharacterized protein